MTEMIEKVARAIHDLVPLFKDVGFEDAECTLREIARAAIEAMREPSEAMALAVQGEFVEPAGASDMEVIGRGAWQAGIDAALTDARGS